MTENLQDNTPKCLTTKAITLQNDMIIAILTYLTILQCKRLRRTNFHIEQWSSNVLKPFSVMMFLPWARFLDTIFPTRFFFPAWLCPVSTELLKCYKSMKELELYCQKQLEEEITLNWFQHTRSQSSTGHFMDHFAKNPVAGLKIQFAESAKDGIVSEPISRLVYSHPMHIQILISWCVTSRRVHEKCACSNDNWK